MKEAEKRRIEREEISQSPHSNEAPIAYETSLSHRSTASSVTDDNPKPQRFRQERVAGRGIVSQTQGREHEQQSQEVHTKHTLQSDVIPAHASPEMKSQPSNISSQSHVNSTPSLPVVKESIKNEVQNISPELPADLAKNMLSTTSSATSSNTGKIGAVFEAKEETISSSQIISKVKEETKAVVQSDEALA